MLNEKLPAILQGIYPEKDPQGWIDADSQHLTDIIKEVGQLTNKRDIQQVDLPNDLIYRVCLNMPEDNCMP